jgi:hypothetical protein
LLPRGKFNQKASGEGSGNLSLYLGCVQMIKPTRVVLDLRVKCGGLGAGTCDVGWMDVEMAPNWSQFQKLPNPNQRIQPRAGPSCRHDSLWLVQLQFIRAIECGGRFHDRSSSSLSCLGLVWPWVRKWFNSHSLSFHRLRASEICCCRRRCGLDSLIMWLMVLLVVRLPAVDGMEHGDIATLSNLVSFGYNWIG